jgi:hypothetical protein
VCVECNEHAKTNREVNAVESTALNERWQIEELSSIDSVKANVARGPRTHIVG